MLRLSGISKDFPGPSGTVTVLSQINLDLQPGDAAAITGPSGCGKSTLLSIMGAIEPPSNGTVTLEGENPFQLDESGQALFRNRNIGFVFQDHYLLPQATLLENVLTPAVAASGPLPETAARKLLDRVGLSGRLDHKPSQLSGGERQRAAIARALVLNPRLLLCDEPTGNLDPSTADSVASLLLDLHRDVNSILVVVTHSQELASRLPLRFEVDRVTHGLRRLPS